MKKCNKKCLGVGLALLMSVGAVFAQERTITVSGSVKFPDDRFSIYVYQMDGRDRINIDSIDLRPDNTFEKRVTIPGRGIYGIDMQKWERVAFWGEDEDIDVDFRGQDTAKVKIKNPPYVHINNPGRNNELMNLMHYFDYMAYQDMIATAQDVHKAGQSGSDEWKAHMKDAYTRHSERGQKYMEYLANYYGDRNSAVVLLSRLKDGPAKDRIITYFEENNPDFQPYVDYKRATAERKESLDRLQVGKPAPAFSFPTPDGKGKLGPADFKGKYLLIDFWASWCGPCLNAIPRLKELYSEYQGAGLEILAVSIDGKADAWKKALNEQQMPWDQVLAPDAGKGITRDYQFSGIPHMVLLDQEGNILARGLTVKTLEEKLAELF